MPRPTWDPTRPQDSDQVSSFPSLHRADKTTLKDIIGTLGPFGSTTTTWRQVQVGDDTWLVQNLYFDGTNWNRDDTTKASVAIGLRSDGTVTVHKVAAGSNPVGTSLPAPVATLDATSLFSALVAGTDPGGTESLRAESARLNAPVLLGSVPQFTMADDPTEALQVATKQYVDNNAPSGGPWRVLGVIRPSTNVASVDFTGLNISPPAIMRLVAVIRSSALPGEIANVHLRVNVEPSSSFWTLIYMYPHTAGGVSYTRNSSSSIIAYLYESGRVTAITCTIAVDPSGIVSATGLAGHQTLSGSPNTPDVRIFHAIREGGAVTSLTSITLITGTNCIGANSVFYLEYLAP
jgi:hypothetical protein